MSGLLPIACLPDGMNGCARLTYAVFGHVVTRSVDAVWVVDETTKEDVELRPVPGIPTAIRLLDARSDGDAVLLVETLESGSQTAGLRALLRLDKLARYNGPMPNGLVPPPNLAEALALPLIDPWSLELSTEVPGKPNQAFAPVLTRRVGPSGFAVEEVYQGHFRRELARVRRDEIARWPLLRSLEKSLRDATGSVWGTRPGILELQGDFTDLTVSGTDGNPTVRSVGRLPPPAAPPPPRQPRIVEAGGPRDRLDALLARQPVKARLITYAPLGPEGATVGVATTEPAAAYGPLLLIDHGEARSVSILDGLSEAGYLRATRVDFRFLDANGDGITDLLVRMLRPERPPWTAIYLLLPPLEAGMRSLTQHLPSVEIGLWINRAETVDAAVESALQIPRSGIRTTEAWPLIAGSRTKAGFLRRSARDAVVFSFDAPNRFDPFAGDPTFRTRDVLTDADLEWLPSAQDDMNCDGFTCSGDRPHCHCAGRGGSNGHHFWFTRERGRLVLAGIARQGN